MLDTSRARALFGFEATTDFEAGLQRTIAWFVARELGVREPARPRRASQGQPGEDETADGGAAAERPAA
jgi:dTDP-D-glucose 4,6-dehydratase